MTRKKYGNWNASPSLKLSRITTGLLAELDGTLTPLLDVGLSYLTLNRPGASLSTGERQRIELTSGPGSAAAITRRCG